MYANNTITLHANPRTTHTYHLLITRQIKQSHTAQIKHIAINMRSATQTEADDRRQCICGNLKCRERRLQVLELVNADHVWARNNGFIEIRAPAPSAKIKVKLIHEALRQCCDYHFKVPQNEQRRSGRYTVASIHFPVSLLETKSQRTKPLTMEEVVSCDKTAAYTGNNFKEKVNQISKLLEFRFQCGKLDDGTIIPKQLKLDLSYLYVQAPVHPGSFVDSFIDEKVNALAQQRSNRRVTLASATKTDASIEVTTATRVDKTESGR